MIRQRMDGTVSQRASRNACAAADIPGPGTVVLNASLNFRKAVGAGEQITRRVEAVKVRGDKPIRELAVAVLDHDGHVCVEGAAMTCAMPPEGI